uniref:Transthyretin-like family-containing protein n=1 Tax=Strongyloides venezuelensis TaxID=75913 RepID=A0A0K0FZR9_STRVS
MISKVILFFLLYFIVNVIARRKYCQSVAVWGRVFCDDRPLKSIKIKLYENGSFRDALLNKTETNMFGVFQIRGSDYEDKPMGIHVNLYHYCTNGYKICPLKYKIQIPYRFVFRGRIPRQPYRLGAIRMRSREKRWGHRDCIN